MKYLVFLNDGETFTDIEGCFIVGIDEAEEEIPESYKEVLNCAKVIFDLKDLFGKE